MTDQQKLETFFTEMETPMLARTHSLVAGGRKYMFDEKGQIRKITDFVMAKEFTA